MSQRLQIRNGLTRSTVTHWASSPDFMRSMNRTIKAMVDEIQSIFDQFDEASGDICVEALRPTFEKSKVYCPKKTGALVNSGYLELASYRQHRGTGVRVEMGYAKNGRPDYGAYVHEMVEIPHAPPTQAKFLERAVMEDLAGIYNRIGAGYVEFARL